MSQSQSPLQALFNPFGSFLKHTLAQPPLTSSQRSVHLHSGTLVELTGLGILRVEPPLPATRQLIISAGIHGNETAPIEVCSDLVTELLAERWLAQTRTLIIFGNPPAMVEGKRLLDFNLNRLFAGVHRQAQMAELWESARAALLEQQVRDFVAADLPLFHYDLHTAIRDSHREKFALYPFLPNRLLPLEQMQFLLNSDVETVLYQHKAGSTFASWTASEFAAESFTVELGKVRPFGENDRNSFKGIEATLRQVIKGEWPVPSESTRGALSELIVVHEIINSGDDFTFHIADDVANFTSFPPGTLIWEDRNSQYRVGATAEAIVFPNPQVPVGQRVGLMVAPLRDNSGNTTG